MGHTIPRTYFGPGPRKPLREGIQRLTDWPSSAPMREVGASQFSVTSAPYASFLGNVPERRGNGIGPWQQIVDLAVRVTVDDLCDDVGEVGVRFDAHEFAGLDQRGDDGPMRAAAV